MFCFAHHSSLEWCSELTIQAVFMNGAVFKTLLGVGADSLFKRSPNAAALCSYRLESHACMSRAAASWLGIISVGMLPMAGSASTMLDARIDAF